MRERGQRRRGRVEARGRGFETLPELEGKEDMLYEGRILRGEHAGRVGCGGIGRKRSGRRRGKLMFQGMCGAPKVRISSCHCLDSNGRQIRLP